MSWLGSTARKGKPKPTRTYRNRAGKVPVHTTTASDSEGILSDQDEPVQVIHKVTTNLSIYDIHRITFTQ